jgi:hypothetical protein
LGGGRGEQLDSEDGNITLLQNGGKYIPVSEGLNQHHRENLKCRIDWKYLSTNSGEVVGLEGEKL